jgi:hypothetical protein
MDGFGGCRGPWSGVLTKELADWLGHLGEGRQVFSIEVEETI